MASKHVLDTHALIWYLESNPRLGSAAKVLLDDATSELVLTLIALAEAVDIVNKGRTRIPSVADLWNDVMTDKRIEVYPLTLEVLQQSLTAGSVPEMHDRLIVATALLLQSAGSQVALLTKDSDIITSALVPLVW